jgi:molybdenum cofactor biosynthesis protein B
LSAASRESAPAEHRAYAPESICALVLTVSDSRDAESDSSGQLIQQSLEAAGHHVAGRVIVPDEAPAIREQVLRAIARPDVDALLLSGGTGVAPRDTTVETVRPLLDKELPGFGELFRALSFEEIGAASMLSRALAGSAGRTAVFCLPGSTGAVRTALDRLILPELAHFVGQLRR